MTKTVLVVDDDPTQRRLIQSVLEREGLIVAHAETGEQAIDRLTQGATPDAIMLDLVMPGLGGLATLKEMRLRGFTQPVVVLTATGGIDTVVQAMQAGAQDFFVKPAAPERIMVSIRNALQLGDLKGEVDRLKKKSSGKITFNDLIGASPAMTMVKRLGERAARSSIPILVLGESGVGKEVIARAVHGASDRAGKPFVAVNCGALPENLIESILFGHEKGSFTGATDKHLGKFQEANGGTLFLDEIGELPLDMQVKLLRALQESEIDPVGSKRSVKVDVRIVSATNRDLAKQVAEGRFREDLYYRLNVFPIEAPALRERREDIPALTSHFIRRFNVEEGKPGGRRHGRDTGAAERLRLARQRAPAGERGLSRHHPGRRALSAALRLPRRFRPAGASALTRPGAVARAAGARPAPSSWWTRCRPTRRCASLTSAAICAPWRTSSAT